MFAFAHSYNFLSRPNPSSFSTRQSNRYATSISPTMCADLNGDRAILSIDVGTSGTKAALCYIDDCGTLGPIAREAHSINTADNNVVTQKPADWYAAAIAASRSALSYAPENQNIIAIAVTGQMQDLIAVGPHPPRLLEKDAILYSDSRAHKIARDMSQTLGSIIPATDILPKLALLPTPPISDSASYNLLLGAADYIIYEFAEMPKPLVTDATTVSTTGLSQSPHREYNLELFEKANLSGFVRHLPNILETLKPTGVLSTVVANALGKIHLAGIPLVHAGGDAFSATIGAGCNLPGSTYLYAGTSGWIGGTLSSDISNHITVSGAPSEGLFSLAHAAKRERNIVVGSMACVCGDFDYARRMFLGGISIEEFNSLVNSTSVGSNGVLFIPYIAGSRCPPANGLATGSLHGLKASSTRGDIARAVVEGVVYGLYLCRNELPKEIAHQMEINPLRLIGGGTRCESFVSGIAALIAGQAGVVIGESEGVGVRGAAAAACVAIKLNHVFDSWESVFRNVEVEESEKEKWEEGFSKWAEVMKGELYRCTLKV